MRLLITAAIFLAASIPAQAAHRHHHSHHHRLYVQHQHQSTDHSTAQRSHPRDEKAWLQYQDKAAPALTLVAQAAGDSAPLDSGGPATLTSDWRGAESVLTRLLAERERTLGKEHPFTLLTAASLALVYKAQGRYAEAGQLYSRTLEASERTLGKDNTFTQATAKALALVRQADSAPGRQRAERGGSKSLYN